jgi:hypothetical protein
MFASSSADVSSQIRNRYDGNNNYNINSDNDQSHSELESFDVSGSRTKPLLTEQFYANERFPDKKFLRHVVTADSDLYNLAIQYGSSIPEIRRHNRRVVFEYLDNLIGEYIHIPVDPSLYSLHEKEISHSNNQENLQQQAVINREQQAIASFLQLSHNKLSHKNMTNNNGISSEEAQFYLEDNNYNVSAALSQYFDDLNWEQNNPATEYKTSNYTVDSSLLTSSAAKNVKTIQDLAAARQSRLIAIVAENEAKLEQERAKQRALAAANHRRKQEILAAKRAAQKEQQPGLVTQIFNGVQYTAVPDTEGFYAIPTNKYNKQTNSNPPTVQEMTSLNSQNTRATTNDCSASLCWPPANSKPLNLSQQLKVSDSSFL